MFFRRRKMHKYINGTRGVISIFLALLMAPFTMVAGALINVGRTYSAVSVFDEALCNASNSTLGTYDTFLKKRFGLLAIKQGNTGTVSEEDVQEFINGVFSDYMKVNCESLPGGYSDGKIETDANGVYPLSDMSVLKNQVLEYSKYNVAAKLVKDALNVDDLIKNVEKSIPGYNFFDTIMSGENEVDNVVTTGECIDKLRAAVQTQNIGKQNYDIAYAAFETAVNEYNSKKSECDDAQRRADEAYEKLLISDEDSYEEAQAAYEEAQQELETAKSALETAVGTLNEKKGVYSGCASSLKSYINSVKEKKKELETALSDTISGGVDFVVKADKAVTDTAKESTKKLEDEEKEKLENTVGERKEVEKEMQGYFDMRSNLGDLPEDEREKIMNESDEEMDRRRESIREHRQQEQDINDRLDIIDDINGRLDNGDTLFGNAAQAGETGMDELNKHHKVYREEKYSDYIQGFEALSQKLSKFDAAKDAASFTKSEYYVNVDDLLNESEIDAFEDFICNEAQGDAGIGLLKAIVGFWDAMMNIGLFYNPVLCNDIDEEYYNSIGGLPSKQDKSYNPYAESDREMSERYKELMGSFSTEDEAYTGNLIDDIMSLIESIKKFTSDITTVPPIWKVTELAKKLKQIYDDGNDIVKSFRNICVNFTVQSVSELFKRKILPAGYIFYNIPCRTNYSDFESKGGLSEMSGEPTKSFCGAEIEYILFGTMSEKDNQTGVFWMLYIIRFMLDAIPIATNAEMSTIMDTLMAIPFVGWLLAIVVLIVVLLVEPLIDTVILCGGGKVLLYKNYVFLMPSGLLKLASTVTDIKIVGEGKEELEKCTEKLKNCLKIGSTISPKDKGLKLEYSHYLILLTSLLVNEERTYKRLADIIQMEGTYNVEASGGTFRLSSAFTYLRASGSFEGKLFIPMADKSVFSSQNRVIYQGY